MFDYKPVIVLVICANCAFGAAPQPTGNAKCCAPEEDAAAAATFLYGSPYSAESAYYTYEHPDEGPLLLDSGPSRFGGLSYNHYDSPSFIQPNENVHVVTKYSNERTAGPVYKKSVVTTTNFNDPSKSTSIRKTDRYYPDSHDVPFVLEPQTVRTSHFERERTDHPEKKKSVYKESTSEGKESSSFNRGHHFKKSYKDPQTPSTIGPLVSSIGPVLASTIGPTLDITPKSPLFSSTHFSTLGSNVHVTPKYTHSSLLGSTIGPSRLDTESKFSDRISDTPLQEAGSKSFLSSSLDSPGLGVLDDRFGYGYGADKHYEKEKGEHFAEAHKKAEGHKGEKDYKHKEEFDKAEEKKEGAHHHKGSAHEQSGEKKGHIDEAKKYTEGHEASKGAKATDFLHKKGHRKGHKKSGFHTVHHKDEFKKDEHFFDEEHDTGEESEHGHKSQEHAKKTAGEKKQGHHDSAYHEEQKKKEGAKEEAHSHNQHAGHKDEEGHKSHHAEKVEHAAKEAHKEAEKHGHSEKDGHLL